jgi:hypothetical protein
VSLTVVYKAPGLLPEVREVGSDLPSLQALVGGYIEVVKHFGKMLVIANEDGLRLGLARNIGSLVGPVFVVGQRGENFRSLTPHEQAQAIRALIR